MLLLIGFAAVAAEVVAEQWSRKVVIDPPHWVAIKAPGLKPRPLAEVDHVLVKEEVGWNFPADQQVPGPVVGDSGRIVIGGIVYCASAELMVVHADGKERRLIGVEWRRRYRDAQRTAEALDVGLAARRDYPGE